MAVIKNNKRKRELNRELKKKNTYVIAKRWKAKLTKRFITRFAQETAHSDHVIRKKFQIDNRTQ